MTSPRRLEQDLPALLADLYVIGTPDYRDELVRQTAATRQRPAWTFPGRWLPVAIGSRHVPSPALPWRALGIVLLLLVLAAAAVLVAVGSRQRVPPPFGPARNGPIAYALNGDILVREVGPVESRTLIGGSFDDQRPKFSPDGTRIMFLRVSTGLNLVMVANADGSAERQVLDQPVDEPYVAWAPDSRTLAITTFARGIRRLLLVPTDGSPAEQIELGALSPTDVAWRPPGGVELIVRAEGPDGRQDLYIVDVAKHRHRALHIRSPLLLGPTWDVGGPAWSQAGDQLAYNAVDPMIAGPFDGHFRIHLVHPDGSADVALPPPADDDIQEAWPDWSPDGRWILVHRWTWQPGGEGWLAVMPADGSAPAHDIGRRFSGGEDTGLVKTWAPDSTRVIVRVENTQQIFSIDPVTGVDEELPWTGSDLPDYQRLAP